LQCSCCWLPVSKTKLKDTAPRIRRAVLTYACVCQGSTGRFCHWVGWRINRVGDSATTTRISGHYCYSSLEQIPSQRVDERKLVACCHHLRAIDAATLS
jgi:hypothetical protein